MDILNKLWHGVPAIIKGTVDRAEVLSNPLVTNVPGFDPRPNYGDYERLYYTDGDVGCAINTIATLVTGGGITWEAKSEAVAKKREKWAREAGFKTKMTNNVTTHLIFGDSYTLPVKDEKAKVGLQVLHPANMKPIPDATGLIRGYIHDLDRAFNPKILDSIGNGNNNSRSRARGYNPDDVLHFRHNQIVNNLHGISIIHPGHDIITLLRSIEITAAELAHRDAHRLLHAQLSPRNMTEFSKNPATGKTYLEDKILSTLDLLTKRVQESSATVSATTDPGRATTTQQKNYSGKTYTIANTIVTDEMVKLTDLAANHNWVGLVQIIRHFQEKVHRALRVPPVFLGHPEGSNRATSHNQLKVFKLYIQGLQEHFVEVVEAVLLPELPGDVDLVFNLPFREDDSVWAEVATMLYEKGLLTLDESRAYIGYPPMVEVEPIDEEDPLGEK